MDGWPGMAKHGISTGSTTQEMTQESLDLSLAELGPRFTDRSIRCMPLVIDIDIDIDDFLV